ncbi:MAG: hypothetical protein HY840_12015 [Bacteroidetes bacterium]|nr:hypothetical protein [Bacteroidota bacterium]
MLLNKIMGRIKKYIEINGKKFWTLFDTGSRNTYVTEEVAINLLTFDLPKVNPVSLGGSVHNISKGCILICKIEGYDVTDDARVMKKIGKDDDGKEIEILLGALTMQQWGIIPVPEKEDIDMSRYPKEFVEF